MAAVFQGPTSAPTWINFIHNRTTYDLMDDLAGHVPLLTIVWSLMSIAQPGTLHPVLTNTRPAITVDDLRPNAYVNLSTRILAQISRIRKLPPSG